MRFFVLSCLALLSACDEPCDECGDGDAAVDVGVVDARVDGGGDALDQTDAPPPDAGDGDTGMDSGVDASIPDAGPTMDASASLGFTVATWNIENFPKVTSTTELVRGVIENHQWDLIAIQEVAEDDAMTALIESLPDYEGFISFDNSAFMRNAILFRRDRVRVENVERLFQRDRYAFPRDPLAADVSFLNEDGSVAFDFAFVVVHLKATLEEASRLRRIDAIQKLDIWAQETVAAGEPDVIIAGDYNDEVSDTPAQNVFGPFLEADYSILTRELDEDAFSLIPFRALIDHIVMTRDAVMEYGAGNIQVVNLQGEVLNYRNNVSDHLPVVARFIP